MEPKRAERKLRPRRAARALCAVLAAAAMACTGVALTRPAVTMAPVCGIPEHTHTDACYARAPETRTALSCTLEGLGVHQHAPDCYGAEGELLCGEADFVLHTHTAACYDEAGALQCQLPEIPAHTHTEACYGPGHVHTEDCFRSLSCTLEEGAEHTHTEECWSISEEPLCGLSDAPTLLCQLPERQAHEHTAECYDEMGARICGKLACREHVHDAACFTVTEAAPELTCTLPEDENHQHTERCYGTWTLTCGLEEHVHTDACYEQAEQPDDPAENPAEPPADEPVDESPAGQPDAAPDDLTDEERALWNEAVAALQALPDSGTLSQELMELEAAGDEEGFAARMEEASRQVRGAWALCQALGPERYAALPGIERLTALEWLMTSTLATIDTVPITAVGTFSWDAGAVLLRRDQGATVGACGLSYSAFFYWCAVQVAPEGGRYYVQSVLTSDGDKSSLAIPDGGFVLLYHLGNLGSSVAVSVGDEAILSSDFWKTNHAYTGTTWGTVQFSSASAEKAYKDNSNQLHTVPAASTRDFIELNLYDYGSGSAGTNINDNFNADKSLPGFQQSGGTKSITSLNAFRGTGQMNLGDIVTDDLADGTSVTLAGLNPVGINVVQDTANSPISRYSDVMSRDLVNGYPALASGKSLAWLFDGGTYARKQNAQSVDGLFQYDAATGAYSFNSRENFAQFDAGSDTFTLYDEIFTPNFIMYPFGNFMPFNDIVHDAKRVSDVNAAYFEELRQQARYLYSRTGAGQYAQLAQVLGEFLQYASEDGWPSDWTAQRALEHYFYHGTELPADDAAHDYRQISLDRLYNLDYDVESDFFFGMEMKMRFLQPKGGLTGADGKTPMRFYFTGDDDVWVYVDGRLFLDLSGIHRHVGGEIDFDLGVVKYYRLDTMTGDVETTPYKTVPFSELVSDPSVLNEKGTFRDYTAHSFNFYYMERGSGSSICRMNFNFPLLRQNSISVTKELAADEDAALLGNPDFRFQVLREGGQSLFIGGYVPYVIQDASGAELGSGLTDENGVFTLKAGQTAVFSGIEENAGRYFVRELLDPDAFGQYASISVDGAAVTTDYGVTVGNQAFRGVDSPVKDVSDGSTAFRFVNRVSVQKLGALELTKQLQEYPAARAALRFDLSVTLDGAPLPVGTAYTVSGQTRYVESPGIVTLAPGETARLENLLAGSVFTVQETAASAEGYTVRYLLDGEEQAGDSVQGTVRKEATVALVVENRETGATVQIPLRKELEAPDGEAHTYTVRLQQVLGPDDPTPAEPGYERERTITITDAPVEDAFTIDYPRSALTALPETFYYRIWEDPAPGTDCDAAVYIAAVTVQEQDGELAAVLTGLWKDGAALEGDAAQKVLFHNRLSSYTLPETGGAGTWRYLAAGGLMAACAAELLRRRRRKGAHMAS